ncbi:MAG TPA: hypothetical protein DDW27_10130 [Bacteroidales bacterium]|nr:hypothetical protein [Bacteroidales bacterium]
MLNIANKIKKYHFLSIFYYEDFINKFISDSVKIIITILHANKVVWEADIIVLFNRLILSDKQDK